MPHLDDTPDRLPTAYRTVAAWTWTAWPDGGRKVPRDGPTEGFTTAGKRGPYLFACKASLYDGRFASFSTTLIARAVTHPRHVLALFVGDPPYTLSDVLAFDPRTVASEASRRTHVDSKRERDVPIFDIAAEYGTGLGDYVAGRKALPEPEGDWREGLERFGAGVVRQRA